MLDITTITVYNGYHIKTVGGHSKMWRMLYPFYDEHRFPVEDYVEDLPDGGFILKDLEKEFNTRKGTK